MHFINKKKKKKKKLDNGILFEVYIYHISNVEALTHLSSNQNGCQDFHEDYHNPDASLFVSLICYGGCRAIQRRPTSQ
jgi:hypothetical protein